MYQVILKYFLLKGNFVGMGSFYSHKEYLWEIHNEVRQLALENKLPSCELAHDRIFIIVEVPELSFDPYLVVPIFIFEKRGN